MAHANPSGSASFLLVDSVNLQQEDHEGVFLARNGVTASLELTAAERVNNDKTECI